MRLGQDADQITVWVTFASTVPFLGLRTYARLKTFGRLFWDDCLVALSWLTFGAIATVTTTLRPKFVGKEATTQSQGSESGYRQFRNGALIGIALFYSSIWMIKFSFLVFFWRLGPDKLRGLRILWWVVFLGTVATFIVALAVQPYKNPDPEFRNVIASGNTSTDADTLIIFGTGCAMDVFSDLLVLVIPMTIVWQVQLRWQQKVILTSLFCLVLVTVGVTIARAVISLQHHPDGTLIDIEYMLVWSCLECSIAIIVACISSFRSLFVKRKPSHRRRRDVAGGDTDEPFRFNLVRLETWKSACVAEVGALPDLDGHTSPHESSNDCSSK